jgi:hypothetical protein
MRLVILQTRSLSEMERSGVIKRKFFGQYEDVVGILFGKRGKGRVSPVLNLLRGKRAEQLFGVCIQLIQMMQMIAIDINTLSSDVMFYV